MHDKDRQTNSDIEKLEEGQERLQDEKRRAMQQRPGGADQEQEQQDREREAGREA